MVARMMSVRHMCERVPGKERARCMRRLYTIMRWLSQRIAETVRTYSERRRLEQSRAPPSRRPGRAAPLGRQ